MRRSRLSRAPLVAALLMWAAVPAQAHGSFLDARPLPGVTVGGTVDEVAFLFPEEVFTDGATITVTAPDGSTVSSGSLRHPEGGVVRQSIEALSVSGEYRVDYSVPALDGSTYEGSFTFEYQPDARPLDPLPFGRERSTIPTVVVVVGLAAVVLLAVGRLSGRSGDSES